MKNWNELIPDKYALVGTHRFTKGRSRPIDRLVIHHNAGIKLTTEACRDLWNNSREASAHYQVEANGVIGQIVNDWDTAWHAANADINARSIGIEHANISGPDRWQISDATVENGAHLVAALCKAYKLGRPTWGKNVFPHSRYTSTGCPWQLDVGGEDHNTYMRRAGYWYDQMMKPRAPKPAKSEKIVAVQPAKVSKNSIGIPIKKVNTEKDNTVDKKTVDAILTQLSGPEKKNGNVTWSGWDVKSVAAVGKKKLATNGRCTPVEALFIIGEDILTSYIDKK